MATITQLIAQKKNNERVSVYVDYEFFCGLTLDDAVKNGLVIGLEMTEAELSQLLAISDENDVFNKTLVYILRTPRTETEIKRYLFRKQCSTEQTTRIIQRLKKLNYINDEAYASIFASQKQDKLSVRAIKHKLRMKGIKASCIDDATQDHDDQTELAKNVAEKYMRYRESDEKNLQRLYRYLVGKGFEYDDVGEIVRSFRNTKGA